jgi:hypothetical protein
VVLNCGLDDGIEDSEGLLWSLLGDGRSHRKESQEQRAENDSVRILAVNADEMNLHQRQRWRSSYGGGVPTVPLRVRLGGFILRSRLAVAAAALATTR